MRTSAVLGCLVYSAIGYAGDARGESYHNRLPITTWASLRRTQRVRGVAPTHETGRSRAQPFSSRGARVRTTDTFVRHQGHGTMI